MKTNTNYLSPEIQEMDLNIEGVLCGSGDYGAGDLYDNPWDNPFGENSQL